MAAKGPNKEILGKIITNNIPTEVLHSQQVNRHTVTDEFQQKIKSLNSNSQNKSTSQLLSLLGGASQNPRTIPSSIGNYHEIYQLKPKTRQSEIEVEVLQQARINLR